MITRQIFFEGKVQGVGFRFACKEIARGFEVVGWVKNLPDGRVELQCSGEAEEISDFVAAIAGSALKSHIKKIHVLPAEPLVGVRGFSIVH